jgi:NAD(P)-dependent dehydrogenase (short-subunit alcohol dehydrogenase family)
MNLDNAVAIVTGSSPGVGAATVKLLATKPCRVVSRGRTAATLILDGGNHLN